MEDPVDQPARLGAWVLINGRWLSGRVAFFDGYGLLSFRELPHT
jgi:hypothetical protein